MSRAGQLVALGALATLAVACASTPPGVGAPTPRRSGAPVPRVHVVKPGDTVWAISRRYGTTPDAVARANGLGSEARIFPGQRLRVPAGSTFLARKNPATWTGADRRGSAGRNDFIWPVDGRVSSRFGLRGGARHEGLDIRAAKGTPIRAAASGRVVHSGSRLRGYGNMIIVKHLGSFSSVYAHNRRNLVRVGEFVEKGQVIAEVGDTGRTTAPHLHFELRRDGRATDPLRYLP